MHNFLVIHTTYSHCDIALFINKTMHGRLSIDKYETSRSLISTIKTLLEQSRTALNDLSCIVVNQGPGPFSTVRSVLATINGLHLATSLPLIGVDSLKATLSEYKNNINRTIVLLNAFNREVYFAIEQKSDGPITGYKKIDSLLSQIAQEYRNEPITFIGNGVPLYTQEIIDALGTAALISENIPHICSLEYLGALGLEQFNHHTTPSNYLLPLYLKKHPLELLELK